MKNRKHVVVAFMLVAAMLLGVGYAALSDTLTIGGTATVDKTTAENVFDEDVKFTGTPTFVCSNGATTGVEAIIDTANDNTSDTGKITINNGALKNTNDTVKVTYTISNVGDLDASVAVPTITNSNETYFTITTDWGNDAKNLSAGASINVEVTITLVKTPTSDGGQTATFSIGFTATSTDTP